MFRWDHRLQIQNLFMAFKWFPDGIVTLLGQQYNTGEKLYYTLTLIAMQGHRQKAKTKQKQYRASTTSNMVVIIYCLIGCQKEKVSKVHGI